MSLRLRPLALAVLVGSLAAAPAVHAYDVWAVSTANQLVRFDNSTPGSPHSSTAISGLVGSDGVTSDPFGQITDLTFVGSTLYGIDGNANLYTLNKTTGAASLVSSSFSPAGFDLGLAYDPFAPGGGFRVVTDSGENFSGTLGGVFTPGGSVFVGAGVGDVNQGAALEFSGLAVDPDFGTGYAFDANLDTLFVTYDANFEEFFTVGGLGGDFTALASFDWASASTLLAALSTDSSTSELYSIDTGTGTATLIGAFNSGITAIATDPAAIPEPSAFAALAGAFGLAFAACRRRRRSA